MHLWMGNMWWFFFTIIDSIAWSYPPRNVSLLEKQIEKMDAEYDQCNEVMAKGEVSGFDKTFLGNTHVELHVEVYNQDHKSSSKFHLRFVSEATEKMKAATYVCSPQFYPSHLSLSSSVPPNHSRCSAACALELKTRLDCWLGFSFHRSDFSIAGIHFYKKEQ